MVTPVYENVDAPDPLLLSGGVCRQLGIVQYHPSVRPRSTVQGKLSSPDGAVTPVSTQTTPLDTGGGTLHSNTRQEPPSGMNPRSLSVINTAKGSNNPPRASRVSTAGVPGHEDQETVITYQEAGMVRVAIPPTQWTDGS